MIDGEAGGLSALSLRRARRVKETLMGKDISEPHDAIVTGSDEHPGEAF